MKSSKIPFGYRLLYCSLLICIPINEAIIFKLTNAVCESYNKSWVIIPTCRLKAVKRDRVIFNMNATMLHPVNDIEVHMQVFKKANGYKPWLIKTEFDFCKYMRRSYNPIAKIFFDLTNDFSNFNHSCPYLGPMLIRGYYPRAELLRLPFPTGDYILTTRWLNYKKINFDVNVSFTFVEDLLKQ